MFKEFFNLILQNHTLRFFIVDGISYQKFFSVTIQVIILMESDLINFA